MPKVTLESCKAPDYSEFPKLARVGGDRLLLEARNIKLQIGELQAALAILIPRIQAKLDVALPEDVTSVLYHDLLASRRKGYTRRSLDTKWAIKKLVAKGVKKSEIDEHTKEAEVEGGISLQLLAAGDEGDSEDEA